MVPSPYDLSQNYPVDGAMKCYDGMKICIGMKCSDRRSWQNDITKLMSMVDRQQDSSQCDVKMTP